MSKAAAEQSRLSMGALTAAPRRCASLSHIPDVTLHPICAEPFQRLITFTGRPVHDVDRIVTEGSANQVQCLEKLLPCRQFLDSKVSQVDPLCSILSKWQSHKQCCPAVPWQHTADHDNWHHRGLSHFVKQQHCSAQANGDHLSSLGWRRE